MSIHRKIGYQLNDGENPSASSLTMIDILKVPKRYVQPTHPCGLAPIRPASWGVDSQNDCWIPPCCTSRYT